MHPGALGTDTGIAAGTAALATAAGLSRPAVYALEAGKRSPAWETVCKLADALGVSVAKFR